MNLIDRLVDSAYDSGYYSGKGEDGTKHHIAARNLRNALNRELTDQVNALVDAASSLLEAARSNWAATQLTVDMPTFAALDEAMCPFKAPE